MNVAATGARLATDGNGWLLPEADPLPSEEEKLASYLAYLADERAANPAIDASATVFAQTIDLLLARRCDGTIERAVELAASAWSAWSILRAAEAASERIIVRGEAVPVTHRLFAIPILVEFAREVPGTVLDDVLAQIDWSNELDPGLDESLGNESATVAPDRFFRLEDLLAMPLSAWRHIAAGWAKSNGAPPIILSLSRVRLPVKRSRIFLRFIVGRRRMTKENHAGVGTRRQMCAGIEDSLGQAIGKRLATDISVSAFYDGSLFDALYTAMWRYQSRKLTQVGRSIASRAPDPKTVKASIHVRRHASRSTFLVAFLDRSGSCCGNAYTLRSRPGDDPSRCVQRIAKSLENAGVEQIEVSLSVPGKEDWLWEGVRGTEIECPVIVPI